MQDSSGIRYFIYSMRSFLFLGFNQTINQRNTIFKEKALEFSGY